MFNTQTTPQEFFDSVNSYFSAFPKNEKQTKEALEKVKNVFQKEAKNSASLWNTYQKASSGDASMNEIIAANKKAQELLVSTRFALFLAIPGSIFLLPALVKFANEYGVDIIPSSVKEEFNV
jgi:hypothetical protein